MVNVRLRGRFDPHHLSSARVRGHMLAELEGVRRELIRVAQQTHETFETVDVRWETDVQFAGGDARVYATTDNEIYGYLNDGTSVRWAVMNDPFGPKTSPGRLRSIPGVRTYNDAGYYTAIRGKTAMLRKGIPSQPGIVARAFDVQIEDWLWEAVVSAVERAIEKGL